MAANMERDDFKWHYDNVADSCHKLVTANIIAYGLHGSDGEIR